MLRFGVPASAVRLKMETDGANPLVLECDPEKPLPKKFVPQGDPLEAYVDGPALRDDHRFARFFKVSVGPAAITPRCPCV
jgi:hypothetical protein